MEDLDISSIVHLNIGRNEFCTTFGTLTRHEPSSMLAVMFGGRHGLHQDPEKGYVFTDRDGTHFRHILNWLRDGVLPSFDDDSKYSELLREADYYQLLGLRDGMHAFLDKRKEDDVHTEKLDAELMRTDIIIKSCIQSSGKIGLQGVHLSGLYLSRLNFTNADFSYACFTNVRFLGCDLSEVHISITWVLREPSLKTLVCKILHLSGANLCNALFVDANLDLAKLKDACLINCGFYKAITNSADLHNVDLTGANLEAASMVSAQLADANLHDVCLVVE